ncbi:hypothetical protein Esti_000733 [Eimeria stiedai]
MKSGSRIASFSRARNHALFAENRLSLQDQTTSYYPSLSLEEDEDCILVGGVPANVPAEKKIMRVIAESWVLHRDGEVDVEGELRAEQFLPTITPGSGHQFYLTFTLPPNIFLAGPATLSLFNTSQSTGDCPGHQLEILRMQDDSFRTARDDSKAIADTVVTLQVGEYIGFSEVDISSLIHGKVAKGEKLHLLFREKNPRCWSAYQNPRDDNVPTLSVNVLDSSPVDATYEAWGEYSKCRLSCTSTLNFRCRKRSCLPGVASGTPCTAEEMLQRQPCHNPISTAKCTCTDLEGESACPANSTCSESATDGARCTCTGGFSRKDASEKTVCQPPETMASSATSDVLSSSFTTPNSTQTTGDSGAGWIKWCWIIGCSAGVILLAAVGLMFIKKRSPPANIEAVPSLQPGAPGFWQGDAQGSPPDMTLNSAFAMAPVPPGTRMGSPGPPRMF